MKLSDLKSGMFIRFGKNEKYHLYLKEANVAVNGNLSVSYIDSNYNDDLTLKNDNLLPINEIYSYTIIAGNYTIGELLYKADYFKQREKLISDIKDKINTLKDDEITELFKRIDRDELKPKEWI